MIRKFLNQSYPFGRSHREKVCIIVGFSFFIFAFLAIFKPFGLSPFSFLDVITISLGYGVATGLAIALNYYGALPLLSLFSNEESWTVGRQLLWFTLILLTSSIFNSIYAAITGLFAFSFIEFLIFIGYCVLVGIFPFCAIIVFDYWQVFKRHKEQANKFKANFKSALQDEQKKLVLTSTNQKELVQLKQSQLLYLTSEDNYVGVVYWDGNSTKKRLLRGSLKSFEKQLKYSSVIRCHRSYIVNLLQVSHISGNAKGYLLELSHVKKPIPVSRSYSDTILGKMES